VNPCKIHDEDGGVIAKCFAVVIVLTVLAGGALYTYGKHQQPLAFDGVHTLTSDGGRDPHAVVFARGATVSIATVVRNVGRLPVTLEGLALDPPPRTEAFIPISLGLGDGRTPTPSAMTFAPPALDPSSGIGVVVTYGLNPNVACSQLSAPPAGETLPPVELRFSSYGVESTQLVPLDEGAPTIQGLTRDRCEAILS
jgi:hypothetical protein